MITKKTVLVLGAGASIAYGLPSGPELKARVVHQLGQPGTSEMLVNLGHRPEFITCFRRDLIKSHPPSIDAYLAIREDYISIGKQAIAATLLPLERTNPLFYNWYTPYVDRNKKHPVDGHWYQQLCERMEPMMEMEDNKLAVITFNYDRSLEHYLHTSLRSLYNPRKTATHDADGKCAEQVKAIPFIHIYGQLGALPWDNRGIYPVPYNLGGEDNWRDIIYHAAECIEIMPEARKESKAFEAAHKLLEEAERIYFLGFGFDPTNVRRLLSEALMKTISATKMYGTFYCLSRQKREFLGRYGFHDVWTEHTLRDARRIPTCRFRDQKICDWLKENVHATFE